MAKGKRKPHKSRAQSLPREIVEAADMVAIQARMRVHGLTESQAKDAEAGTPHGLLYVRGQISQHQYDALEKMIALCGYYSQALSTPNRPNLPREAFSGGSDRESLDRWCATIIKAYDAAKDDVTEYSRQKRMALWTNFEMACLDNGKNYSPRMDNELSHCANILADHFGIAKMDKAV